MQRIRAGETLLHVGDKSCGVTSYHQRQRKSYVYSNVPRPLPWEHSSKGSERKPLVIESHRGKTMNTFLNNLRHHFIEDRIAVLFLIYST